MKKYFTLLTLTTLILSGCSSKEKVQLLPEAELGKPYFTRIDFSDGDRTYERFFEVIITPKNSGLSASGLTGQWDNETIISGTPKTKQDISIEIFYVIRGPVGFFESHEQSKYYKINVKE